MHAFHSLLIITHKQASNDSDTRIKCPKIPNLDFEYVRIYRGRTAPIFWVNKKFEKIQIMLFDITQGVSDVPNKFEKS